jgi:outer membrane protein assembly factor BamB
MVSGLTPTAGGVLFTGDLSGYFLALDSETGDELFRFNTGGGIAGAAATYLVDGKQYVAITSGNHSRTVWNDTGAMTVVVFSLNE